LNREIDLTTLHRGFMRNMFWVDTSSPGRWSLGKPLLIVAGLLTLHPRLSAGPLCNAVVRKRVEVAGEGFSLADLLAPDTCPPLLHAANDMHLGATPRVGSLRVLEKDEVREYFAELRKRVSNETIAWGTVSVPERVVVRRAGSGTSCKRVVENLMAAQHSAPADRFEPSRFESGTSGPFSFSNKEIACGAVGRIPEDADLEATKTAWDAASGSWKISARCVHASDCVPFLVRVRAPNASSNVLTGLITSSKPAESEPATETPLVPAGAKVTLIWEKDAIRVVVPAIALDSGGTGEVVRARIARSGYVVHAVVVSAGIVRATA
jgi:hypothetical protein